MKKGSRKLPAPQKAVYHSARKTAGGSLTKDENAITEKATRATIGGGKINGGKQ